ncbi:MAG: UbiD family decarboxylase, partial [Deltaproteobacteria bacterium]|nr:UbiD family decarboxylase [Deltaproteobacteria bacterium]
INKSAAFLEELRDRGLPVSGAYVFPEGTSHGVVVAVKPAYYGMAGEIAHVVWGSRHGCITPWVIVVEDDVDPFNMEEVLHAMMSKCHPSRGIVKVEQALAWPLFPWLSEYERGHRIGARAYFDCTWPVHWDPAEIPARMSFKEAYPEEVQQKALEKLRKYGF